MSSGKDSYNHNGTTVSFDWPSHVSAVERVALSARGDLQRTLSAFFDRTITIAVVYCHTAYQERPDSEFVPLTLPNPDAIATAAPNKAIIQTRQVHLQCEGRTVCTATSTVRLTSPHVAHLFLVETFPIGQMFRRLEKIPAFELLTVGQGPVTEDDVPPKYETSGKYAPSDLRLQHLWRKYTLKVPLFECEILEEFPARDMFIYGEDWFSDHLVDLPTYTSGNRRQTDFIEFAKRTARVQQNIIYILGFAFLLMLLLEISKLVTGRSSICFVD